MPTVRLHPFSLLIACAAALLAALAVACSADSAAAVDRAVMAVAPPRDFSNIRRIPGQDSNWYMRPHYEYLVGFDKSTGAYVPQLATEWNLEPDGHSWRFLLREGVQFHDGHGEFTAEDVRFSWLMNILPDDASTEANTLRNHVLDVEIVNDHEVVFHTDEPFADTFEVISEIQGGMEIASKADFLSRGPGMLARRPSAEWADYAEDPRLAELTGGRDPAAGEPPLAGTAPYRIVEMNEQTGVVYQRFDDYWGDKPDFPEFEFQFIPEASTRLAKLLAGEAHLAKLPEELASEAQAQGFVTFGAQVPATRFFLTWQGVYVPAGANATEDRFGASGAQAHKGCTVAPNAAAEDVPFLSCSAYPASPQADLRVRKALNKAIDRAAINEAFFDGKGLTMHRNHYLPDNAQRVGWNPEWETRFADEYGYDPDAARALLAEAGYDASHPLRTTMQLTPLAAAPAAVDVQQAVANYWRDIGVEVTEQQVDPTEYIRRQREMHWDNHIFSASSSGAQLLTMQVYGSSIFPSLYIGFQDPATEALIREAYQTNTPQDRDDLLRQAGNLAYDMHQDIPLFWLPNEVVAAPDIVEGWVFSGMISGAPVDHLEGLSAR